MSQQVTKRAQKTKNNYAQSNESALPTFMDHVHELQGRLFVIFLIFLAVAGMAYPFFDKIVALIVAPLGNGHDLVYLTPGGAFSFIIKVCLYIGIIGSLPVIIYQLYQFLMPAVRKVYLKTVLAYTASSLVLAIIGIVFAYEVSLPAAIHFLTSFDLYHINPMLTIDSYFSFVMTYLLAGALLFQLPLVMLIINSVTPLTPSKLMGAQRGIIVGSFVVAAVISPTPDALNQTLLASPMVLMYQLGIVIIWVKNRSMRAKQAAPIVEKPHNTVSALPKTTRETPMANTIATYPCSPMRTVDGIRSVRARPVVPQRVVRRALHVPQRQMSGARHQTIDGFFSQAQL